MNPGVDSWIGVLGGGQLGRMLSLDARRLGFKVLAWTGGDRSGAASTADELLENPFDDPSALEFFSKKVQVATVEFENLPRKTLEELEQRIPLYPNSQTISICQHREREKTFLSEGGFNCAKFQIAKDFSSFKEGLSKFDSSVVVKTAEFGYDGKGQVKIEHNLNEPDITEIWESFEGGRVVIEELISLKSELSVLITRNNRGEMVAYDPVENIHRNHILDISIAPARISLNILQEAQKVALEIAEKFQYVGILAVEFFLSTDGKLLVNELAPRPHNSGHHTINACTTSQFENQARAITGLPLGSTQLLSPVIMMNLMGDIWQNGTTPPNWSSLMSTQGASLHLYGKKQARKGRKMGHISFIGKNLDETIQAVNSIRNSLNLPKV